jgi:hypothetical protein
MFSPFLPRLMGIFIRVISPTPSKNPCKASRVVQNDKLPTQIEFWRLGFAPLEIAGVGEGEGEREELGRAAGTSSSFRFLEESFDDCSDFSCFFFCRLRSACDRMFLSVGGGASSSSLALTLPSLSDDDCVSCFLFLDGGGGLLDSEEDEEDDILK